MRDYTQIIVLTAVLLVPNLARSDEGPRHAPPIPLYSVNTLCVGDSSFIVNHTLMAFSYQWSLIDSNGDTLAYDDTTDFKFVVDSVGEYTISMWATNGHVVIRNETFFVDSQPTANFYYSHCFSNPEKTQFYNLSTCFDSLLWSFGDGTFSTDINPEHQYSTPGGYEMKLTAFHNGDTVSYAVADTFEYVEPPLAEFAYYQEGDTVYFTALDTTALSYYWELGDNSTCWATPTCEHQYLTTDTFIVRLSTANDCGYREFTDTLFIEVLNPQVSELNESSIQTKALSVFPNPSNGQITIKKIYGNKLSVVDALGKLHFETEKVNSYLELNLPAGMYYLIEHGAGGNTVTIPLIVLDSR